VKEAGPRHEAISFAHAARHANQSEQASQNPSRSIESSAGFLKDSRLIEAD